jgi:hypothetical protein
MEKITSSSHDQQGCLAGLKHCDKAKAPIDGMLSELSA